MAMRRRDRDSRRPRCDRAEMPRSPGHAFYDRLQALLQEAGFDAFVEDLCKPYYAPRMGSPSLPPGRYFRMHMVGYFEGIDSEARHLLALFGFAVASRVPAPGEPRQGCRSFLAVEDTLAPAARGPRKGFRLGSVSRCRARFGEGRADRRQRLDDGSQRCPADDRARYSGETYRQMLTQMAKESGVETPTIDDLVRLDRKRKGKKLSNKDWTSPTDPGCEDRADEGRHHASGLQA